MTKQKIFQAWVEEWRGQPAIRIPTPLAKKMRLKVGQKVTLAPARHLGAGACRHSRYKLADLLKSCRGKHPEHWSTPVGGELI
jgi:antitoxin component of MazEF toxin-antitoxin module